MNEETATRLGEWHGMGQIGPILYVGAGRHTILVARRSLRVGVSAMLPQAVLWHFTQGHNDNGANSVRGTGNKFSRGIRCLAEARCSIMIA